MIWLNCKHRTGETPVPVRPKGYPNRGCKSLRACVLRPVTECNCVAARPGGEQQEVNGQSVARANSIRPDVAASLLAKGEAQTCEESLRGVPSGRPGELTGNVTGRRTRTAR